MKKHIALFLVVATLLALCACTSQPAKDTTSEQTTADASSNSDAAANTDDSTETAAPSGETVTIRVSGLNQQLSLPLWYIHEQGWDVENGFNLELTVFAQGSGINEALGSGLVDVFTIGAAGISSCSVYDAVYLYSHEDSGAGQNFVVRADSDIAQVKGELADYPEVYGSADTLRGKKFLLPMGTAAQILADVYLQQFGLTEDDVTLVNMNDDSAYQAFVSGEADLAKTSYPTTDNYDPEKYVTACGMATLGVPYYDNVLCSRAFFEDASKHDALVSFIVQMIRTAETFQDDDVLMQAMLDYYEFCGVSVDAEAIRHQVLERPYFTYEQLKTTDTSASFKLLADFYEQVENITTEDHDKVMNNMDTTILAEALDAYAAQYVK